MAWTSEVIQSASKVCNIKTLQSAAGVLEFLAQGLPFLRAPLVGYVQKLLEDWNGSASILNATGTKKPDLIIYSDASGTEGFGFLEIQSRRFGTGKWNTQRKRVLLYIPGNFGHSYSHPITSKETRGD